MTHLPLSKGMVTSVDEHNYAWLKQFRWHAAFDKKTGRWYANRSILLPSGKRTTQSMHRLIMGNPVGMEVDHKNGDGLCNLEENLRVATGAQNQQNRRVQKNNTSGAKGVCWRAQRWEAHIRVNGTRMYLGRFNIFEAALQAYNEASIKYHGEFGFQNPLPANAASIFV